MKRILSACLVLMVVSLMGQVVAQGCSSEEASQFDFWLGEWDLSWPAEQTGAAGSFGRGSNVIEKILDGCAIQENFSFADGSYRGQSVSTFNPRTNSWRQTWVDTGGAYLLFNGGFEGGQMELRTEAREQDDKTLVDRMVFRDITEDALKWDWQRSEDGGETWVDVWNISYQRK